MDGQPSIERTVSIEADPEAVWDHHVDGDMASLWMGGEMHISPRQGGDVGLDHGDGDPLFGAVEEIEPGRTITWTWRTAHREPTQVTIDIEPEGDGCRVTVIERLVEYQFLEAPPVIVLPFRRGHPHLLAAA